MHLHALTQTRTGGHTERTHTHCTYGTRDRPFIEGALTPPSAMIVYTPTKAEAEAAATALRAAGVRADFYHAGTRRMRHVTSHTWVFLR